MRNTHNLTQAKKGKNDEFYTQWTDIEKEINAYLEYDPAVFRGKTILLPADDPFESNFFKFFATHFNDYGLKKLISTSYDPSPIVNTQLELSLFDDQGASSNEAKNTTRSSRAYRIELTNVSDFDDNGRINIADIEIKLRQEKLKIDKGGSSKILKYLNGDDDPDEVTRFSAGDFRSQEVTRLRDEADVVITNPPFSLFREFLQWINPLEKQFLIIGNMNAITYKEVFPLIKGNHIWLGTGMGRWISGFIVPNNYKLYGTEARIENGQHIVATNNALWLTNLDHGKRHEPLSLMTMSDNIKFSKHKQIRGQQYRHYDNYDAIEVPFTDAIPSDYDGMMGVPISFLDKYNPDQFEILGITQRNDDPYKTKRYTKEQYKNANDLNARATIITNGVPKSVYARILIRKVR